MTYSNDTKFQDNIWTTATSGTSGPTKSKPASSLFTTGFLYGVTAPPPEAPNQNWLQNRSDSFCALIEKYGSISYLTEVDYDVGATVYNDNNGTVSVYKCNIPNGPSTATVNPVGDTSGTWTRMNQWGSKGYNPNTVIVSDAVGNIFANNIPFLPWLDTTSYPIGALVTGSDGNQYYANQSSLNIDPISDTTDKWRQYPCKKTYTNNFNVEEYFDGRVVISMVGPASDNNGKSNIVFPLNIELKDEFYFPQVSEISATVSAIAKMGIAFGTKTKTGFGVWVSDEDGTPRAGENPYIYVSYSK